MTTITRDASIPTRPSRIATSGASSNNFDSGSYVYDGAGNIRTIGADSFGHDARSRLTSAALAGQAAQRTIGVGLSLL